MKYSIIYADPPWAYLWGTGVQGGNFAPEKHYKTMQTPEICELPIKQLREKNCVLALWPTGPCLPDAFQVMKAWGFNYKNEILEISFSQKGWESQPAIFGEQGDPTGKTDFLKERAGIEVEFGHSSFIWIDVWFKKESI